MDVIKAGTLLIENGTLLPRSLVLASEPYSSGWTTVANLRSDFERDIKQAGWTFFFLTGDIHSTVFAFNPQQPAPTPPQPPLPHPPPPHLHILSLSPAPP